MNFIEFQKSLSPYPVFSLNDILKLVPDFNRIQLDRWEKKDYLQKIKRGFYCFCSHDFSRDFLFHAANKIYSPSYVSLEMALKYYRLIPDEIFQVTSVSTVKRANFETSIGTFSYRHIKPSLYWGYRPMDFAGQKLLLAEPEKALLDYLYVHTELSVNEDFKSMRVNLDEFSIHVNLNQLQKYLKLFNNKGLACRVDKFLTTIQNAHL